MAEATAVLQTDAVPSDLALGWDTGPVAGGVFGSRVESHVPTAQRVITTPRAVDAVIDRWEATLDPIRPQASVTHTAQSISRRTTRTLDLDELADPLDSTLTLLADDVATARL